MKAHDQLPQPELPLMSALLKVLIIWGSIDVVVLATGLYLGNTIRVHFPNWWKRVICDDGPEIEPELDEAAPSFPMTRTFR
jgi:hypothetical protein